MELPSPLVSVVVMLLACTPRGGESAPPSAHNPLHLAAPDFERATLAGTQLDTKALRGKVVVVKFFAKYCRPCRRTLPEAQLMHAKYGGDVVFVGVSEDEDETDARKVVSTFGLTFPVVHDSDKALAKRFHVTSLPATFVIDAEGVVQWVGRSAHDESDLEQAIADQRGT